MMAVGSTAKASAGEEEEEDGAVGRLARDLAKVKQRVAYLESILSGIEQKAPYASWLIRGEGGPILANVAAHMDIGKVVAVLLVPLREETVPFRSFFCSYVADRERDGLILSFDVHQTENGNLSRISVTVTAEPEVKNFIVMELLGKLRWTLSKMYENQRKAEQRAAEVQALPVGVPR